MDKRSSSVDVSLGEVMLCNLTAIYWCLISEKEPICIPDVSSTHRFVFFPLTLLMGLFARSSTTSDERVTKWCVKCHIRDGRILDAYEFNKFSQPYHFDFIHCLLMIHLLFIQLTTNGRQFFAVYKDFRLACTSVSEWKKKKKKSLNDSKQCNDINN